MLRWKRGYALSMKVNGVSVQLQKVMAPQQETD